MFLQHETPVALHLYVKSTYTPPPVWLKAPFLPRLGLLAVATSTGVVTVYSLPHPDALHASKGPTGERLNGVLQTSQQWRRAFALQQ